MDGSLYLFENLGRISARYVLEADEALGLGGKRRRRAGRRLWRTVLIAAVIVSLLSVTAYAAGLLGLRERVFPVEGTERVVVGPNGLKGTKTYEGTGEWWSWQDEHRQDPKDYDLSFLEGNDQRRKTCELYRAYSPEAADKLFEIAETYGLSLYSESVQAIDRERLFSLTGMEPFLTEGMDALTGGYVFPDGSFNAEGRLLFGDLALWCELHRFSTGALYPFGGAITLPEYCEREYVTALGQTVDIVAWQNGKRLELWYLSEDGETFVSLCLLSLPSDGVLSRAGLQDRDALAEYVADRVDFAAVCRKNDAAREIISVPRSAEDNRDAAARLAAFYESDAFRAAREFQDYFTANFYGASFTGVYGQEGYEDISAELERLGEKYGLRYATSKYTAGNTVRYDNGAMCLHSDAPAGDVRFHMTTYFIPKDALYTGMVHYVDATEYQRVWLYETAEGQQIVCFTDGPEKISGSYLFYETEYAWVLVGLGYRDPGIMEQAAELIEWSDFG